MAEWITPVYDRTQSDVDYAKLQLAKNINDVEYKGCFNSSDINRIEGNARYLADILISLYYFNNVSTSTWNSESLPYKEHIDRIINNIGELWGRWDKPQDAEDLPVSLLNYEQVNTVEKNLFLLKEMLGDMESYFIECGTFNCGEV